MRIYKENIAVGQQVSFVIKKISTDRFSSPWHFHPEYELTFIESSHGHRFVGDSIEYFEKGDLVLLGPDLPHTWKNPDDFERNETAASAYVVQFDEHFLGRDWLEKPEFIHIRSLLNQARLGIQIRLADGEDIASRLKSIAEAEHFKGIIALLELLNDLARQGTCHTLSSPGFLSKFKPTHHSLIDQTLSFVKENFKRTIKLNELAQLTNMSVPGFCRYFKRKTGKSFVQYLNTLRLGYACRLLIDTDMNVSEIGYECGFNNLANFNRQFLKYKNIPPKAYRKNAKYHDQRDQSFNPEAFYYEMAGSGQYSS